MKKRIMIFLPSWGLGGSTIYILQYVKYFTSKKNDVYCVCKCKDEGSALLKANGSKNIFIKYPLSLPITASWKHNRLILKDSIKNIFKFIYGFFISLYLVIKFNPNLVIIGEFTLLQVFIAVKLLNKNDVVLIQGDISKKRIRKYLINKLLKHSNLIIGITKLHICQLDEKITNSFVIYNSIPYKVISDAEFLPYYESLNINTKFNILFLGGISELKGSLDFIKLANEIFKHRNDVSFIIAGAYNKNFRTEYSRGSSNAEYNYNLKFFNYIEDNDLINNIKVIGETKCVLNYISKSTIVVSMNTCPHFSRPVIEAWKMKKPVISNDDKYSRLLIENGENGFIVEKGNIYDWRKKCDIIFNNPDIRKNLSENGYKKFKNEYSNEAFINNMNKVFYNG